VSEEAEARLEQSFRVENSLDQALDMAYGPANADLLRTLGRIMSVADGLARFHKADRWFDDGPTFDSVRWVIGKVFKTLEPAGSAAPRAKGGPGEGMSRLLLDMQWLQFHKAPMPEQSTDENALAERWAKNLGQRPAEGGR
jgi:hypothetical protein